MSCERVSQGAFCNLPATIRTPTTPLTVFIALQSLDVLTTLVFLRNGVQEGNPLVGWAISTGHTQWIGLVLTKLIAALIGQYCYRSGHPAPLRWANKAYSLVIGWNLFAIAVEALTH